MIWFKYFLFISTKVTFLAPLLAASKPIIPEPEKISKNDFSFKGPIVSKKLFLHIEVVGLNEEVFKISMLEFLN
mgnify:CR=1